MAEVLVPGEPEERARARRSREGITLPAATWAGAAGRWRRASRSRSRRTSPALSPAPGPAGVVVPDSGRRCYFAPGGR